MQYMKRRILMSVIACAIAFASTAGAEKPEAAIDAAEAAAEQEQMQRILSDFVRAMSSGYDILEGVHDRASADAAAPKVKARFAIISELEFGIQYMDEETVVNALAAAGVTEQRLTAIRTRIIDARYYGSLALATALNASLTEVLAPGEVTPELIQTVGSELQAALQGKINGISGGPGLTEESAWKMGADPAALDLIPTIMDTLPHIEKVDQKLVRTQEGPIYGRMTYLLPREDKVYEMQMWFDITEIILAEEAAAQAAEEEEQERPVNVPYDNEDTEDTEEAADSDETTQELPDLTEAVETLPEPATTYTPQQKQAAIAEFARINADVVAILSAVHDCATADTAARQIEPIMARLEAIGNILPHVSYMDILEAMEALHTSPDTLRNEMRRIDAANYFGSAALRRVMSRN